jgi:putative tryptophan/tyrosine transport system substrate-binding protein
MRPNDINPGEPAMLAFFDEMRLHGFVEGQNVAIVSGGFQARNEQIDELVSTLVKAATDVIPQHHARIVHMGA